MFMEDIYIIIVGAIVGVIGSIVTTFFTKHIERKNLTLSQKFGKVIEKKAEVYIKLMYLLRSIAVLSPPDVRSKLNNILDEIAIWGSDEVYKEIKELLAKLQQSSTNINIKWPDEIAPIIIQMVKDFRDKSELKKNNMIPIIRTIPPGLPDIYDLARIHSQKNFEELLDCWHVKIIDDIIEKYKFDKLVDPSRKLDKKLSKKNLSKPEKIKLISTNIYR